MVRYRWYHYEDEIVGRIYSIEGHQLYGDSDFVVRIFRERRETIPGFPQKEYRYFPQINVDSEDRVVVIGSEDGYRHIGKAKRDIETILQKLLNNEPIQD